MPGPRATARAALLTLAAAAATLSCAAAATAKPPAPIYFPPDPLPPGVPGDVIKSQPLPIRLVALGPPQSQVKAWRILYRSTSATGQPNAVSGLVVSPAYRRGGPRAIIALAHGFQGLGDGCAPSWSIQSGFLYEQIWIAALLSAGFAVTMTDYEGQGTPSKTTFGVGVSEGHAVLDSVRAARRLTAAKLSSSLPVAVTGYSQGGGAADFAAEQQPTYAPDVPLIGVAAGGAPVDLISVQASLLGGPFASLALTAAIGMDAAYPELDLPTFLSLYGRTAVALMEDDCLGLLFRTPFATDKALNNGQSVIDSPLWRQRLWENSAGHVKTEMPMLMYHGLWDEAIPYRQHRELKNKYCALGANVRWRTFYGGHVTTYIQAIPMVIRFIDRLVRGDTQRSECAPPSALSR